MLGPLSLEAMGKEQGQLTKATPFQKTARYELIDNRLGAVGKITKLSFPNNQGIGAGRGIAIFECQHRELREYGVNDLKPAIGIDLGKRCVSLAVLLVMPD